MSYMLLIVEDAEYRRTRAPEVRQQAYDRMMEFRDSLKARGVFMASDALATAAVRVKAGEGKPRHLDGPFAEAKEIVGGYFLVNCATLDEALKLAEECPATAWATVEVREVMPCFMS
ncbi:MAG: YciI family protein [Panacagrimonas sp.]